MIQVILFFLVLIVIILIFVMIQKDREQRQEKIFLKSKLDKLDNDLLLAKQEQKQIKAENAEEQAILDMMRTLTAAEKIAKISSLEAFTQWLSSALPHIWNKIKGFVADVWRNIQNFFR